ncbi:hypothetical protein RP20_CCG025484 [Aedes albopictus]|nr:hypothetical protein RP20_CCG025484 [Aedes albopictus]
MGEALKEHLVVAILLSSLPKSFNPLVIALEGRPEEDLKLDYVKGKLLDEWKRRNESQERETEKVMKIAYNEAENRRSRRVCHRCKQEGHFWRNCPVLLEEMQERVKKKDEAKSVAVQHSAARSRNREREVCFTASTGEKVSNRKRWVVDTGCTKHMTGSIENIVNRRPCNVQVKLADGRTVRATECGRGSVIECGPEGSKKNFVKIRLKELLYVPGLSENVLSVGRITDEGYSVVFNSKDCRIMDDRGVVAIGENDNGLYFLTQCA